MEIDPIFIWNEYVYLEDDFVESIRYLPLVPEHYEVWSAHFADLIIRIGSVFDSFLKRAIFCELLTDEDGIEQCREKYRSGKNITIKDYYDIFEQIYNLSSKNVYDIFAFETVTPFSSWANNYDSLGWWKAYTKLKHDRFANKEVATLEATLNALGGLFLLNVLYSETAPLLVDYGIIKGNYSREFLRKLLSEKQPIKELETIYAKTKLFGYVFELEDRDIDDSHKRYILSSSYPGYG